MFNKYLISYICILTKIFFNGTSRFLVLFLRFEKFIIIYYSVKSRIIGRCCAQCFATTPPLIFWEEYHLEFLGLFDFFFGKCTKIILNKKCIKKIIRGIKKCTVSK